MGLDFALVRLPYLIRAALEKNKIVPVSRGNWVQQSKLTFSCYKMLGVPSSCVQPVMHAGGVMVFFKLLFNKIKTQFFLNQNIPYIYVHF